MPRSRSLQPRMMWSSDDGNLSSDQQEDGARMAAPDNARNLLREIIITQQCISQPLYLHLYDLVVVAVGLNGVEELVKKVASISGDEVNPPNAALLQRFVGIERLAQSLCVPAD